MYHIQCVVQGFPIKILKKSDPNYPDFFLSMDTFFFCLDTNFLKMNIRIPFRCELQQNCLDKNWDNISKHFFNFKNIISWNGNKLAAILSFFTLIQNSWGRIFVYYHTTVTMQGCWDIHSLGIFTIINVTPHHP